MTDNIKLPPLPKASKMYDIPGYDEEELKDYARAAVLADRAKQSVALSDKQFMKLNNYELQELQLELADAPKSLRNYVAALHSAIAAQAPSVPEGWVMVPVQPTEGMKAAGCRALGAIHGHYGAEQCWKAMLEAAMQLHNEERAE